MFSPFQTIRNKQNREIHSEDEIRYMVDGFTDGSIPDYQMSAWLMAIYFNGMTDAETRHYTHAMVNSGKRLDFSYLPGFVVDKHSTGGVGDKVSLILGPLLASCGFYVPMLSGRGLGHTGGTLDKLESIPGYRTMLNLDEFKKIVETTGISIMGQTQDICPADKKIYALRDVTSTVASLPLICGSIMSKKIAEGIQGLVLDVKCGNGAFMTTQKDAEKLADLLRAVGQEYGLKMASIITNMNQPLGEHAGVWCEVKESIDLLTGKGPADVREVILILAEQAMIMANISGNHREILESALDNGVAMEKFERMISSHGGSVKSLTSNTLHCPKYTRDILADKTGWIQAMDTYKIGMAIVKMGGGRTVQTDKLDNSSGITFNAKVGSYLHAGDIICTAYCSQKSKLDQAVEMLKESIIIGEQKAELQNLII
ncbi:MAG: thymidine phosphorylase [Fidelibacterota bacterium]